MMLIIRFLAILILVGLSTIPFVMASNGDADKSIVVDSGDGEEPDPEEED